MGRSEFGDSLLKRTFFKFRFFIINVTKEPHEFLVSPSLAGYELVVLWAAEL